MGTDAAPYKKLMKSDVSIIIPCFYSTQTLPRTLESLKRQTFQNFETIVVNSSQESNTTKLLKDKYPWVKFHQHPHRLLMHAARNHGVMIAEGELFLFTDPDLEVPLDWVERMFQSHWAGHRVLVGEMDCSQKNWMAIGIHLTKYHFLLPGVRRKQFRIASSASAGYDRRFFKEIGDFPGELVCGDAVQSWKTIRSGELIYCVRGVPVRHYHDHTISRLARERRQRGREFMQERIKFEDWRRWRIWANFLLFPTLPAYILFRAARDAVGSRWFFRFVWTLPIQVVGQVCWCFGELEAQIESVKDKK